MTDSSTLHSRLRVLVAKTFRAEKLYLSMRDGDSGFASDPARLADLANEVRSSVWQRRHSQLRKAVNRILSSASSSSIAQDVEMLRGSFEKKSNEHREIVERARKALIESVDRCEFAHSLKLSAELIRSKAETQANQIVADELTSVLQMYRKKSANHVSFEATGGVIEDLDAIVENEFHVEIDQSNSSPSEHANVIPFRRRASGFRSRR